MKRLDWTLVRPPLSNPKSIQLAESLEIRIAARLREATHRVLTRAEVDKLASLEERLERHTVSTCIASKAPRIGDAPHWEHRIIDEFNELDLDYELDEYLELRRDEFDCERCPYAAKFSLYPQDPCEISVGPLLEVLDSSLQRAILEPMGPEDMTVLADRLADALNRDAFSHLPGIDIPQLLASAVHYLRTWSKFDFGLRPELVSEHEEVQTPDDFSDGSSDPGSRFN